ncbi:MAG: DUF1552 domain-containing protein [Planctomycetes bacterium]|nr:DUF1552 domain-containing protein [Planctomycetota bacterium]
MPFLRRVALDRRAFLRGGAACVALPWLDAMVPALTSPPAPPRRAVFVFSPNGMHMQRWRPVGDGRAAKPGPTMASLEPLWSRLTVFRGLAIDGGRAHGDGPGDHARSAGSFLTCAHPRKTGGEDIHVGVSVDQVIAARLGAATAFPSLELGMEGGRAGGVCDSGYSCAYSNNVSWRAPEVPVTKEHDPRAVFARLFGDPELLRDREAQQKQRELDRSVLDLVQADAKALQRRLGAGDRQKVEQYLESVRELEKRLQQPLPGADEVPAVPGALFGANDFPAQLDLMYELLALALATDKTRVVSFMLGNGGSNRSYRFLGVPEGHHDLSHHGKVEQKLDGIAEINRFHVERFAGFLQRLAAARDGDRDLLASSLVVLGSGLGDGNRHNHDDLPVLLAGEGCGAAEGRGHVQLDRETPMANLYLAVLQAMGCEDRSFADSTEALTLR